MARVSVHQLFDMLRGGIGGLIFRHRPDGMVIVSGKPHYRKGRSSAKQKAHRQRFKEASRYARWAQHAHPIYKELEAERGADSWKSAYNFALSDWFEAPVIHAIERRDGCIRVQASDNVRVAGVRVSVLDEAGTVLDAGDAVRCGEDWWEFTTQVQGKVKERETAVIAEAWDLAENVTRRAA